MFDTHCHLNFSRFKKNVDDIISNAHDAGVTHIVVPGTDIKRSKKAVEIASGHSGIYAAVGIHPHHVFRYIAESQKPKVKSPLSLMRDDLNELEVMLSGKCVVAVGEVGMDKHVYKKTKYEEYSVDGQFIDLQKELLRRQIALAVKHKKSLIIHNREAKDDLLSILKEFWDPPLAGRSVFHCCEPDMDLYKFAKEHDMYLGVDGDITYWEKKQNFWKEITKNGKDLSMMVLETDAPYLLPEPYRSQRQFPNTPSHLLHIAGFIAGLLGVERRNLLEASTTNAKRLFNMT